MFWRWFARLADLWSLTEPVRKLLWIPIGGGIITPVLNWLGIPLWQAAVIGLCIVIALAITIYLAVQIGRELSLSPQSRSLPPLPQEDTAWLKELADRDLRGGHGVIAYEYSVNFSKLQSPNPYIDFSFTIFNGLVWDVEIDRRATGHIDCVECDLSLGSNYSELQCIASPLIHASGYSATFHYWVTPEVASQLQEKLSAGALTFDFSKFKIWILRGVEKQRAPLYMHRQRFCC